MKYSLTHRFVPLASLALSAGTVFAGGTAWIETGNNPASNNILGALNNVPINITSNSRTILEVRYSEATSGPDTYRGGSLIGGYWGNVVNGAGCTVLGGFEVIGGSPGVNENRAQDFGCSVLGGGDNQAGDLSDSNQFTQPFAMVGGGFGNEARGAYSTVIGGLANEAKGRAATNIGGSQNRAGGDYSMAGGWNAVVRSAESIGDVDGDQGCFVWSDRSVTSVDFTTTGPNQFLVRAAGGMGVGTNAPRGQLEVSAAGSFSRPHLTLNETTGSFSRIAFTNTANSRFWHFSGNVNGATINDDRLNFYHSVGQNVMQLTGDGRIGLGVNAPASGLRMDVGGALRCTNLIQTSSGRFKTDVEPVGQVLERLMQLRPVTFTWDAEHGGERDLGLIAEEVADVFPEAVACVEGGADGISYSRLTALAIKAVKEQHEKAQASDARVEKLEAENKALMDRLAAIEARLAGK